MQTEDDVKDFPVVKAKTPTQLAIDKMQAEARARAKNSAIREEVIEIPPDVDTNRLAEIAKSLAEGGGATTSPIMPDSSTTTAPYIPLDYLPVIPSTEGFKGLVISVTTVPFTPMRTRANEQPSISIQKYHVLIETSQSLQLGKEYQIVL